MCHSLIEFYEKCGSWRYFFFSFLSFFLLFSFLFSIFLFCSFFVFFFRGLGCEVDCYGDFLCPLGLFFFSLLLNCFFFYVPSLFSLFRTRSNHGLFWWRKGKQSLITHHTSLFKNRFLSHFLSPFFLSLFPFFIFKLFSRKYS